MEIETLGDALTHSVTVQVWCAWGRRDGLKQIRDCGYHHRLDMETLVCTRGRAFPMARLAERLKCPRCGSTRVRVLFSFPGNTTAQRAAAAR
jgi:hypothetical protein